MADLSKNPRATDKTLSRVLNFGGQEVEPSIRYLRDMVEVIYDKAWARNAGNPEVYYIYHNLALSKKDRDKLYELRLRYDITLMPPFSLGLEFVKTIGHINQKIENTDMTYSELHEVLTGEAHFIIQKEVDGEVEDVYMVYAEDGDKIIIPPNYGYVIINPSNRELRIASIVSRDSVPNHEPFKKYGGAAYFELKSGLVKNERYAKVPKIRVSKPTNYSQFGLKKREEIYGLVRDIALLEYITAPQKYKELWEKVLGNKKRSKTNDK
ncbi:MAG: glucose-6-phosphate isomerase family protein [Thermoplasmata archaeon]